jgi:hypothetical protein
LYWSRCALKSVDLATFAWQNEWFLKARQSRMSYEDEFETIDLDVGAHKKFKPVHQKVVSLAASATVFQKLPISPSKTSLAKTSIDCISLDEADEHIRRKLARKLPMLKGFNTPEGVSYAPVDCGKDLMQSRVQLQKVRMPRELREEEYDRAKLQSSKVVSSLYAGNAPVIGRVMRYGNKTYKFDGQKLPTGPDHKNAKQIVVEVTPISGDPDIFISLNSIPDEKQHTWYSAATGADRIMITPIDPDFGAGVYFIGVFSPNGDAEYSLSVALEPFVDDERRIRRLAQSWKLFEHIQAKLLATKKLAHSLKVGQLLSAWDKINSTRLKPNEIRRAPKKSSFFKKRPQTSEGSRPGSPKSHGSRGSTPVKAVHEQQDMEILLQMAKCRAKESASPFIAGVIDRERSCRSRIMMIDPEAGSPKHAYNMIQEFK